LVDINVLGFGTYFLGKSKGPSFEAVPPLVVISVAVVDFASFSAAFLRRPNKEGFVANIFSLPLLSLLRFSIAM
jgi:hypothetical protein